MITVIVDYGSGNLHSAAKAVERAGSERGLDARVLVTGAAHAIRRADRLILPGVGAFGACAHALLGSPELVDALAAAVLGRGVPLLGICVGLQLLAESGEERGCHQGLGWLPGTVVPVLPDDPALKVPHMGWNNLEMTLTGHQHPVFADLGAASDFYFVHGYHFACPEIGYVLAHTDYGGALTAAVGRDNVVGVQFHPEKSQHAGLTLLGNFLSWSP